MPGLNSDGSLSIVGREKDLINSGGFAVYPQEINEALISHPSIQNAYTSARNDELYSEYLVALVEGDKITEDEVITYCREILEEHKIPRKIIFTQTLPLGPSGKVNKNDAELLINYQQKNKPENNDISEQKIIEIAANIFNLSKSDLSLHSNVSNTPGWDSLGHLMLITEVEQQFNFQLSPIEIMSVNSLSELFELVPQ